MGSGSRLLAMALAGALAGCVSSPPPAESIEVSDPSVLQVGARAAINLSGRRIQAPSSPASGHAVELGFTRGSGSGTQDLGSGYATLGSGTFNAPARLAIDFDLNYLEAAYRFRHFVGEGAFGVEGFVGLGYADLAVTASAGALRASESLGTVGAHLGGGLLLRFWRDTTAQLRLAGFASGQDDGVTSATRVELSLVQPLGGHAAVRAGYAWWQLQSERGGTKSPIEVELRGPVLVLEVMF